MLRAFLALVEVSWELEDRDYRCSSSYSKYADETIRLLIFHLVQGFTMISSRLHVFFDQRVTESTALVTRGSWFAPSHVEIGGAAGFVYLLTGITI